MIQKLGKIILIFFNPDGLILSNGNDIEEYSDRDKTESKLVNRFLEKNLF